MAEKSCRINVYTSADKIAWHHASFSFLQNRKFLIKLFHSVTVLTLPQRVLVFGKGEPYFPLKSPVPTSITIQSKQVKRTPQDSIIVVPVTGAKFKAAFLHA